MGTLEFLLALATLVLGTGWLFTYRAFKRKANGEATQVEADGWAKQQEVYQKTIEDMQGICDRIREDRNHLRDDRNMLREDNDEMRKKYKTMEEQMDKMQQEIIRLERMIEGLTPLLCGSPTCLKRIKVDVEGNMD